MLPPASLRPASLRPASLSRLLADYGMLGVLLLLCVCCTVGTIQTRRPVGRHAADRVARRLTRDESAQVVIISGDKEFADATERLLRGRDISLVKKITGQRAAMRKELVQLVEQGQQIDILATTLADLQIVEHVKKNSPSLRDTKTVHAKAYWGSVFLSKSNLLNVAKKNADIALIAVGMTIVIITGGIDLSVGSLTALSAVLTAVLIVFAGGKQATPTEMFLCSMAAIAACAVIGTFSGVMITLFRIPPFIATLAMMWVGSGLAYIISGSETIANLPKSFGWLGMGEVLSIPNSLILMIIIYAAGHVIMSRTLLGRHIYAIGGNRQAARLSGIRVNRRLLVVYAISGAMAGIAGVLLASQFTSGSPRYGRMYELYAIAAVVVGGTSLAGGEGKILGTLIGVLTIAVVQTAMNLLAVGTHWQNVTLGLIVLLVVQLDMMKRHGWRRLWTPQ